MWLHEHEQCFMWSCSSKSTFSSVTGLLVLLRLPSPQNGRHGDVFLPPAHWSCCFGDRSRSGTSSTSNISEASRSIASRACKSHCPELITGHNHIQSVSLVRLRSLFHSLVVPSAGSQFQEHVQRLIPTISVDIVVFCITDSAPS